MRSLILYVLGFDGDTCDNNIDDCAALTCANNGACIDGVAQAFCKCQFGKSGPTCEKGKQFVEVVFFL